MKTVSLLILFLALYEPSQGIKIPLYSYCFHWAVTREDEGIRELLPHLGPLPILIPL